MIISYPRVATSVFKTIVTVSLENLEQAKTKPIENLGRVGESCL